MKIGLISLGCAKNQVDSEMILGVFKKSDITNNIEEADVIIINTCGFINDAKQEAIDTILEICEYENKIYTNIGFDRACDKANDGSGLQAGRCRHQRRRQLWRGVPPQS